MEKRAYGTATVKFKKRILGNDLIFEKWGIGTREVTLFETWLQIKRVCYGYVIFSVISGHFWTWWFIWFNFLTDLFLCDQTCLFLCGQVDSSQTKNAL